ncbi:Zn-dependent hydrolase [Flagellimonas aquimarina]|uniref:Zn-dependent hydrolase n=1 Tax=Flagellimonas aquimarina TaxID=2201895 RepID=A0A316KZA7_9FLAO|nr:MBL fold metallo-hydrolase [Allomuricauda koreensis]PWL38946.1 Zn-dependent hydrolase [Allomuricauda koreensis]
MKTRFSAFILYALTILSIQSCTMVKVSVSEKRNPIPQKVVIGKNITLTSWGTIKINKSHFFPSSFQVKSDDYVIYIDPVEVDKADKADFILITHSHPDHFSVTDIKKLLKKETKIVCPKGVSKKLKDINNDKSVVVPLQKLNFRKLDIETIAAYNTKSVFLWIKAHPKSKKNVGYVLTLKNDLRIYHAGDTDYVPEMKALKNINVALVPIGGDNLTMNEEEAAKIINEVNPNIAVPMHYEINNRNELKRFKSLVNKNVRVVELE